MKKEILKPSNKKLTLTKTAIAQLTMTQKQMNAIVGGQLAEKTSKRIGDENCTITGTDTV